MSEPLTEEERKLLDAVPKALRSGVELLEWWREVDSADSYKDSYKETYVFNRPEDSSFGFFDTVELSTGKIKINGNVQKMFYDEPKSPAARGGAAAEWIDKQLREFILHYFMRVSDFRQPQQYPESHPAPPPGLDVFSQCPAGDPERRGFGYAQQYFKRCGASGERGIFDKAERDRIVDLRRLGEDYEWIVVKNPVFNFSFDFKPFGNKGPQLKMPVEEFNYLVVSPDFVVDERNPEPGILGRYGLGYAFVNKPERSALGYGPGELEPAFELLVWEVDESGEVTVRATFVAAEPKAMLNLSLNPFAWGFQMADVFGTPQVKDWLKPFKRFYDTLPGSDLGFDPVFPALDLMNFFTFGQAGERFCISTTHLKKDFLFIHFLQHYQAILGSLQTWRQIPDWLDSEALPKFVVTGRSA